MDAETEVEEEETHPLYFLRPLGQSFLKVLNVHARATKVDLLHLKCLVSPPFISPFSQRAYQSLKISEWELSDSIYNPIYSLPPGLLD